MTALEDRLAVLRRETLARRLAAVTVAEVYRANLVRLALDEAETAMHALGRAEQIEADADADLRDALDDEDRAENAAEDEPDDDALKKARRDAAATAEEARDVADTMTDRADEARDDARFALDEAEAALRAHDDEASRAARAA